jgi:hypothetical protein
MNWSAALAVAFGLLLMASPIIILVTLRSRDPLPWTAPGLAGRWRDASQEIRASVVILGTRWVGVGLIGLSLIVGGFGFDAYSLLVSGIVVVGGSVTIGWIWRGWSWMNRRHKF